MAKKKKTTKVVTEPFMDYLGNKSISPSLFKGVSCPKELVYKMNNPTPETQPMVIGRAFHLLMEGADAELNKEFEVLLAKDLPSYPTDTSFRNTANKQYRDELLINAKLNKKSVIMATTNTDKDAYNNLFYMRDALLSNTAINWRDASGKLESRETLSELLEQGLFERSFYTIDKETNLRIKFRADWNSRKRRMIIDFKTARTGSLTGFYSDAIKLGYDSAAAYYIDFYKQVTGITEPVGFWFSVVEKTPPFLTNLFLADDDFIEQGRIKYRRRLNEIAKMFDSKVIKGYEINDLQEKGYQMLRRPDFDYYDGLAW